MRLIVTGGAGFIGHNVVRMLEGLGHQCSIIDNLTDYGVTGYLELNELISQRTGMVRSTVHTIDISDEDAMEWASSNLEADVIIHLASFPRQATVERFPVRAAEVMGTGLVNVLQLATQLDISKFVYISSSMVYGNFCDGADEYTPCNPIGQYGIMKLMGEQLVKDWSRRNKVDHVIVRPSAVYGERDINDRVIGKFIINCMRDKPIVINGYNEILDFTHVEDAAQGIVLAATKEQANNRTFNITRNQSDPQTLYEAATIALSSVGKGKILPGKRDPNFPVRGRLDNSLARIRLGYKPTIDLREGINRYFRWLKDCPTWKHQ